MNYWIIVSALAVILLTSKNGYSQQTKPSPEKRNWSLAISYYHNNLFQFSLDETENPILDLSEYHKRYGLSASRTFKKNFAVELGMGGQYIPEEKTIDSISWTPGDGLEGIKGSGNGRGGIILPITAGIRKYFQAGRITPFLRFAPGLLFMKVGSGTASGSVGDIKKEVDMQTKLSPYLETGTGVQVKIRRSVLFDFGFNGYFTPSFSSPVGNCSSYSGWNITAGITFKLKSGKQNKPASNTL